MINVTRLFCGTPQPADNLRYGTGYGAPRSAAQRRPVVVWNLTRRCNLKCVHCYSESENCAYPGELDLEEGRALLDDLKAFGVPAVLFSGGEPTLHPHFFAYCEHAADIGLRVTISTNGTRITPAAARRLKKLGVAYVGISLDGIGRAHDEFRGKSGTFEKVVTAFANCRDVDQKAGLRLTLTPQTASQLPEILDFIEREKIPRVCFYHLVPSGRGSELELLDPKIARDSLALIARTAIRWHEQGFSCEVLTVDQPADGAYFWMLAKELAPDRADDIARLLEWNGGGANGSGVGIANIDSQGNVHPDQFWQTHHLGNVRQRPFSEIWTDNKDPLLAGLRNRLPLLNGRCKGCRFIKMCGGGFRVRALNLNGSPWADDPGCYLEKSEIHGEAPLAPHPAPEPIRRPAAVPVARAVTPVRAEVPVRRWPGVPSPAASPNGIRLRPAKSRLHALREEAIHYSLRRSPTFENLAESDLRDLSEVANLKSLQPGEFLFRQADPVAGLFLVRRGIINLHHVAADGREIVLHFYREGETLAEAAAVSAASYPADAVAVVPTEVIVIPRSALALKLRDCPELALSLLGALDRQLRTLTGAFEDVTSKNAGLRFVEWLLRQCHDPAAEETFKFKLKTTKRALASELGVRQETLSRTLRHLCDAGQLAVQGARITINSPRSLRAWSEKSASLLS